MWKVHAAALCRYNGNRRDDNVAENPGWQDVHRFIDALDGDRQAEMWIEGPKRYVMVVSGGGRSPYGVSVIGDDMGPYEILGEDRSDETVTVISGGVNTDVPRKHLVGYNIAVQAAKYFFDNGGIDPSLDWELY